MKYNLISLLSGLMIGVGSVLLKMFMTHNILSDLALGIIIGGTGAVVFQFALKHGKSNIVIPLMMGAMTVVTVLCGMMFLSEMLSSSELAGTALILIGTALAVSGGRKL